MDTVCEKYRAELSALMDNQLEKEFQTEVESHVSGCTLCSQELDALKNLTSFLSSGFKMAEDSMPDIWGAISDTMPGVCELMRDDFSAYLDGELTAAAQEGVNVHLKECSVCLADFKTLNATNSFLVKGLELPESIKVDIWPSVKARLNEDCALIHSELSPYLDQEVVALRHRSITTHLMDCPDCRTEFNSTASVGDTIRDFYKPEFAEDFDLWPGIKSKLQVVPFSKKEADVETTSTTTAVTPNKVTKFGGRKAYLTAAAAVSLAVIGSLTFFFASPQPAPAEAVSSEGYLIESALSEPADVPEAMVYEQQQN